jgi:hypothetical protein
MDELLKERVLSFEGESSRNHFGRGFGPVV